MRRIWLTSLVLFLATFAVFSRALLADFVKWDDDISVYQNPHIQGLDWEHLRWMFTDASYALRYEPLNWLSYALIYQFGGLKPFGYHLANLVLHCLNTVLLFAVIRRLLGAASTAENVAGQLELITFPAALGTLLWALNPLRVEPVAHVTDLRYCLLLFFLLVSLWSYLRAHQTGSGDTAPRFFNWCSLAAFALSMLSLPFAFAYAAVLLVVDWYPLRRFEGCTHWWLDGRARKVLLEKIPFLVLGGLLFATFFARVNPTGIWAAQPAAGVSNPFEQGMQALYVWAYYAWKPWVPFHLSPLYTTLVNFNPNSWPFWSSAALVVGITALLVRRRNQLPWAFALWVSHLVLLVPALGLTERPHYAVDRYDYLPGLVWAVAIAAALQKISTRPRWRLAGMTCAVALALFWGTLSLQQTQVWQNSIALFEYMIPELGNDPSRASIYWRLGWAYVQQGKTQKAVEQYQTSLRIQPAPGPYLAFAELLEQEGDREGALTNYLGLLELGHHAVAYNKAGDLLSAFGRTGQAIAEYRQALFVFPNLVPVLNNLAWILATDRDATNRNGAEAVQLAERACTLTDRQIPVLVGTLAAAYAEAGRFKEAIETAQQARALAQAAGQLDVAEKNRQLLELYQSGQSYRQPPPPAEGTSGHIP
jgi:tetratricopeptide (TPR) repeat protein